MKQVTLSEGQTLTLNQEAGPARIVTTLVVESIARGRVTLSATAVINLIDHEVALDFEYDS